MTESYRHTESGIVWYFYNDVPTNDVIAERLDTGDKMRFSNWEQVEESEYWEKA